jgi:hypothetical protein
VRVTLILRAQSEFFRDAISELDSSSERMTFTFTPPPKKRKRPRGDEGTEEAVEGDANMRVEAVGNQGSAEVRRRAAPCVAGAK